MREVRKNIRNKSYNKARTLYNDLQKKKTPWEVYYYNNNKPYSNIIIKLRKNRNKKRLDLMIASHEAGIKAR